jgi:hypothetical protein
MMELLKYVQNIKTWLLKDRFIIKSIKEKLMAHTLKLIRRSLHKAFIRKARLNDRISIIEQHNKSLQSNTLNDIIKKDNEFLLTILYKERIQTKDIINTLRDEEQDAITYFNQSENISDDQRKRFKLWHAYPESNKYVKNLATA